MDCLSQSVRVTKNDSSLGAAGVSPGLDERVARAIVAAHRARLEWLLQVPEWEPLIEPAMRALDLPGRRQGIGLRAAILALPLESKHELARQVIAGFRLHLRSSVVAGICRAAGIERFDRRELDEFLTARQWSRLREQLLFRLGQEHRRYKHAQQLLFVTHRSLVDGLVDRVVFSPQHRADCAQEGAVALLQAIDRVDATEGDIRAYAATWVKRAMRNFLLRQRLPVYAPVNLVSEAARRGAAPAREKVARGSKDPESERLVALLHECLRAPAVSFDEPAPEGAIPLRDQVADDGQAGPVENTVREDLRDLVGRMLEELTDKQREVLVRRFGLGGRPAATLEEIARVAGISRQQAGMREKRALLRMEVALAPFLDEVADAV
ncbi:MAG: sigma-70 family RNA polymerase sigma factor [Opitutaceae bacterium]